MDSIEVELPANIYSRSRPVQTHTAFPEHGIDDVASLLDPAVRAGAGAGAEAEAEGIEDLMELDEAPRELRMDIWSSCRPDHDEDAHFCHPEAGVVGVADGVGGCRGKGVDAAAFSHGLMTRAYYEVALAVPGTTICPYTLLERAYQRTVAVCTQGASTAVILSLAGRTLKWAYVGDSGFAVFRGGKIVHRSEPQQVFFNCPFQLRTGPGGNEVNDAAVGEIQVKEGDVVAVASDGLFDNLFDAELEEIVRTGTARGFTAEKMANTMADEAQEKAMEKDRDSPFSVASREQNGTDFKCGKIDDITVVVAFIVS